jgi:hypothetical protein
MCQCEDRPCCGCDDETRDGDSGMSKEDWLDVWQDTTYDDWSD